MNREIKRRMKRDRESKDRLVYARAAGAPRKERTKLREFLREVRSELKRVMWPSPQEVITYSVVVLVVVVIMVGLVFLFDLAFAKSLFALFKPPTRPS